MSQLLDQVVAKVRKLPDTEQDVIASVILDEMEDERRWEETFARSPSKLAALLARAREQVRMGHCQSADFDEL